MAPQEDAPELGLSLSASQVYPEYLLEVTVRNEDP